MILHLTLSFHYWCFRGQEEVEEVQQSYSEFYQSGGGDHQTGYNDEVDTSHQYNTMGGESTAYNTIGGASAGFTTASRTGTMNRTDVIVDTLGASSAHSSTQATTTVEEETTTRRDGFEEQEQNISFA